MGFSVDNPDARRQLSVHRVFTAAGSGGITTHQHDHD